MRDFILESDGIPPAIGQAATLASQRLASFLAQEPDQVRAIFGASDALDRLIADWTQSGADLSGIAVVPDEDVAGASAAYVASADMIVIAETVAASASVERLADILVEELGHRIDARVNALDSPGDEGESLAVLLRGEPLSSFADDNTVFSITGLGEVEAEQVVSVSDSGGFEGSSQSLTLEGTSGGTITYRYQHFTIPDRFIIRYEGQTLFDTGFTGGSRSGTIPLPAGSSDTLQVIMATDDAGTAWNYDVSVEAEDCGPPDPWIIEPASNEWEHNSDTDQCEVTDTLTVGRKDGAAALIRADGAAAAMPVDSNGVARNEIDVKGATVFAVISGETRSLFTGDFKMNLNTGVVAASDFKQTATGTYKLASMEVDFKSMSLLSNKAAFDIDFVLPDFLGSIPISLGDFINVGLQFTSGGALAWPGFKISPPGKYEAENFLNMVDISASNLMLEYRAQEDALRFQGKLEFANTTWMKSVAEKLVVDLAGTTNYVQVNSDGRFDAIGKATATVDVGAFGFSLSELEVTFNTTTNEIGGSATLGTPFGVKFGDEGLSIKPEVEFVTSPEFELDKVGLTIDNINKPIPAYPVFFFQQIGGSVDNFASTNTKAIELGANIGASLGPQIGGNSLAKAVGEIKVSTEMIEGKLTTDILPVEFKLSTPIKDFSFGPVSLAKLTGTQKLDWKAGFYQNDGVLNVLDGFFTLTNKMKFDKDFNFGTTGKAEIGIPDALPSWAGGGLKIANSNVALNFTDNGNSSDDFAAGWGTYVINVPWVGTINITKGLRANFDGSMSIIGADNIPKTSSWFIEDGRDYVLLTAAWENDSTDTQVRVIKPDGTIIEEADFVANEIMVVDDLSDSTGRTVVVGTPEEGTWDLEVVDDTGLGQVDYFASGEAEAPTFSFDGAPVVNGDGTVTYDFTLDSSMAANSITFYYDDDLSELDGGFAGSVSAGSGSGSFTWDPTGVVPGSYFLYALVDDGQNPITVEENADAVSVGSEADVGVEIEASTSEPETGDTVQYTFTVTNNSGSDTARGVVAHVTLPNQTTQTDASETTDSSDFADIAVDLGDLAPDETKSFTVDVEVDATEAGTPISADVLILSDSYDPVAENDTDATNGSLSVPVSTALPDLAVDSGFDGLSDLTLGQSFTYSVTVTNNGAAAAMGVVLTEFLSNATGVSFDMPATSTADGYEIALGDIAAGDSVTVEVTASPEFAGTLTATSNVRTPDGIDLSVSDDQTIADQPVVGSVPDEADLSIAVAAGAPASDGKVPFDVTLTNDGPGVASSIEVEVQLPAGVSVDSFSSVQGTFDSATGIWSVGNMRDALSRTITLMLDGVGSGDATAEVVNVVEDDPDSSPDDGEGDDFASTSIAVSSGGATDGDDLLVGTGADETFDALAGDDTIRPGGGDDTITTGEGEDQVEGTPGELFGDTITDLTSQDVLIFTGASFGREDIDVREGSAILGIDSDSDGTEDGSVTLEGDYSGGDFMAVQNAGDTHVSFAEFLPSLEEAKEVAGDDVNGIVNQGFLMGDGTTGFRVTADVTAMASFKNVVGVYEINSATGDIVDVQILWDNFRTATGTVDLSSVEAGNELGFFIAQDAGDWAGMLADTDTLSFVNSADNAANLSDGSDLLLAVNGVAEADLTVFHSYDSGMNDDGVQHALSGVVPGGEALVIGFEDLTGGGDNDYQDVMFMVETF